MIRSNPISAIASLIQSSVQLRRRFAAGWAAVAPLGIAFATLAFAGPVIAEQEPLAVQPSAELGPQQAEAVQGLFVALRDQSPLVLELARSLAEQPEAEPLVQQAVRQLQAAWLEGQSEPWTRQTIAILEQWSGQHADARGLLVRLLEDSRPAIRQLALEAAVRAEAVPNPRILPLIASLRHAEPEQRYKAAGFLAKFGAQAAPAAGALVRAAQDGTSHAALRWEAVFALRDIGPAGVAGLIEVLQTTDRSVAYKALDSLQTLGPRAAPAYQAVVNSLGSDDPQIRWRAAAVLGRLPDQTGQSQHLLQRLLNDSNQHVRDAAAEALQRMREPSATDSLRDPRTPP